MVLLQAIQGRLCGLDVFLFIDNSAAEGVLLKAYSRSPHLTILAALFWQAVRSAKCAAWVGRVPSDLNIADGPSRRDYSTVSSLQMERVSAHIPEAEGWKFFLDSLQSGGRRPHPGNTDAAAGADAVGRKAKRQRAHQGQG